MRFRMFVNFWKSSVGVLALIPLGFALGITLSASTAQAELTTQDFRGATLSVSNSVSYGTKCLLVVKLVVRIWCSCRDLWLRSQARLLQKASRTRWSSWPWWWGCVHWVSWGISSSSGRSSSWWAFWLAAATCEASFIDSLFDLSNYKKLRLRFSK